MLKLPSYEGYVFETLIFSSLKGLKHQNNKKKDAQKHDREHLFGINTDFMRERKAVPLTGYLRNTEVKIVKIGSE